jgi:hypothetical protein
MPYPYSVTSTVSGATLVLSVTGFCWAISQWAPFALVRRGTRTLHPLLTPYPCSSGRRYYPSQPRTMRGPSISLTRARHASLGTMRRPSSFSKPTSMTRMTTRTTTLVPGPSDWETGGHTPAGSIYPSHPLPLLRLNQGMQGQPTV